MLCVAVVFAAFLVAFKIDVTAEFLENGPGVGFVRLEDRGYKGILIAIDPAVPYNPHFYNNIYNYMSQASSALYKATSKETPLYFKEMTVLLPPTWPEMTYCNKATSEVQNEATFLIGPDTDQWGSNPHTIRLNSQCGQPGLVTILPESFIKDENVAKRYGDNIGKTILHEWAHLRYGVFDESNEDNGGASCKWFEGGAMYPVKCSTDIKGQTRSLPSGGGCEFVPDVKQPDNVKSSVMYKPYLETIHQFCDKQGEGIQHNRQIPNSQNDRCDGKSVWEVLRQHPDFNMATHRKKRDSDDTPEKLTMTCVQSRDIARMVLTMDVSSSMKTRNRLLRMQQDVRLFLKSIPCRDTAVGLVEFSATNTEKILHKLVKINTDKNLQSLIDNIPDRVINRTCLGCGILKSLRAIRESGMSTQGAVIAVFTDGLENDRPKVDDVTQEVINSGAVVYGLLLHSVALHHPLIQLSRKTGGISCIYSDKRNQAGYHDCLEGILRHRSPNNAPIQVIHTMVTTPPNQHKIGNILVDSALVNNALVSITWDDDNTYACNKINVSLVSPSDRSIGPNDTLQYMRSTKLKSITIDISGYQAGQWTYIINNNHKSASCTVRLLIKGRTEKTSCSGMSPNNPESVPVMVFPKIDGEKLQLSTLKTDVNNAVKLYLRLVKGSTPVLNALVTAEVQSSSGKNWSIPLWDNGAGADFMAQDGIYSRYFIGYSNNQYNPDDSYSVKFDVKWQPTTKLQLSPSSFGSGAPVRPQYKVPHRTKFAFVEPFQRTYTGQYISVRGTLSGRPVIFSPAKISNLRATLLDRMNMKLKLTWTAVGYELDNGIASAYEIRISTNAEHLRQSFKSGYLITDDHVSRGAFIPKSAGQEETFEMHLANHPNITSDTTYYIAVKASNINGLSGPVSNVQMFIFVFKSPSTSAVAGASSLPNWMWYVVGVVIVLVLAILLAVLIVLVRRRKKNNDTDTDTKDIEDVKTTTVENVYMNDDRHIYENVGASKKETSSGVNAPDLLSEIQVAKANLKKQKRYKKKEDGVYTISSVSKTKQMNSKSSQKDPKRKSLLKSIRNSGSGIFKRQKSSNKKNQRQTIIKPWMSPDEPLQNHSYTNPLFGESAIIPEMIVRNSVIVEK